MQDAQRALSDVLDNCTLAEMREMSLGGAEVLIYEI